MKNIKTINAFFILSIFLLISSFITFPEANETHCLSGEEKEKESIISHVNNSQENESCLFEEKSEIFEKDLIRNFHNPFFRFCNDFSSKITTYKDNQNLSTIILLLQTDLPPPLYI